MTMKRVPKARPTAASIAILLTAAGPAAADLIAHYPLHSDLADSAGANDGLFEGAGGTNATATFVSDVTFGNVLDFDGVDDRVSLGPVLELQNASWSISLWVRTPPSDDRVPLVGKNDGNNGFAAGERVFEITGNGTWGNIINPEPPGNLAVNGHSQGGVVTNQSAVSLDDGGWHMVTMVHDETQGATHHDLYIDGVLQPTGAQTMNNNARANVGGFYLGFANASGSGAGGYLTGQMAEVNFYDSPIGQAEVDLLFAVTAGDQDPNLVAPASDQLAATSVPAGAVQRSFGIRNSGFDEALTLGGVTFTGADADLFSAPVFPASLVPAESGSVEFTFTPTSTGTFSAVAEIASNDVDSPAEVALTIDVVADPFLVAPAAVVLGEASAGQGAVTRSVDVSNSGLTQDLEISGVSFSGASAALFSNPVLPGAIPPGGGASIGFDLDTATAPGIYSATMEINSNSQGAPVTSIPLEVTVVGQSQGSLVAYWPFDHDAADVLGDHDGTLQNDAAITTGGLGFGGGEALMLGGGNGVAAPHVTAANPEDFDFNSDFTWHAYVKTSSASGGIFGRVPATGSVPNHNQGSKSLFLEGGRVEFDTGWVGNPNTGVTVHDDQWHQVIVTYLAATDELRIWVDAAPGDGPDLAMAHDVNRYDEHTHNHNSGIAETSFRIGQVSDNFQNASIVGLIDEAAVFDAALNGSQLDQLIAAGPASFASIAPLAITAVAISGDQSEVTLSWTSKPGELYAVTYSTDLLVWDGDLDDGVVADAGEVTTRTFDIEGLAGQGGRLYMRVERQ